MIENSAPLPWDKAQDRQCKGKEEIRKSATESLLPELLPYNPTKCETTTARNTPVIYFHKNISEHTTQNHITQENNAHTTANGPKITYHKHQKRGPGQRHTRPARGSVLHELSTPQGGRASPRHMPPKTFEIPNGADNQCYKKQNKNLSKIPQTIPNLPNIPHPDLMRMLAHVSFQYAHNEHPC